MNNCDTCVWATRNGGCASWGCDYIPMQEAAETWKALRGKTYPCDPAKNTTCTKTGCYYVNGGDCFQTMNPEYKRDSEKVGKWKYETMRHIITGEMRSVRICSECGGGWFRYDMSDGVEDAEPNYCPNCGARMAEGEEDE